MGVWSSDNLSWLGLRSFVFDDASVHAVGCLPLAVQADASLCMRLQLDYDIDMSMHTAYSSSLRNCIRGGVVVKHFVLA